MNRIFKILSIFIVIIVIFTACAHSSQNRNLDTYSSNTGNRHNDNKYADEETENVVAELPTVGSYEKLVELLEEIEGQSGIMFENTQGLVVISDADFLLLLKLP